MARSFRFLVSGIFGVAAAAQAQACTDDEGSYHVVDDDGGSKGGLPDGLAPDRRGDDPLTTSRIAHLAKDLGAIDFCYQAARAGAFEGPVLKSSMVAADASIGDDASDLDASIFDDAQADAGLADGGDGGSAAGLTYARVSKYVTLRATGTLAVAIVAGGSTSCSDPLAVGTITLDPGKLSTIAVLGRQGGDGGPDAGDAGGPEIVAFTDDRETKPDKARVRLVHAADAAALTVRVVGAQTTILADRIEPRRASSPSQDIPVDALGFATIAPVAPPASIAVSVLPGAEAGAALAWQSQPADLDLRGGSLHTGFVLPGTTAPFAVLWCADKSTLGERTACTTIE